MGLTNFPSGISSMGMPVNGGNPFGNTWFVSTTGSDGYKGQDTTRPFATIQYAIDRASAGDTVILSPGSHEVDTGTDGALIPKADMQFIAAIPPLGGKPSTIITADADDLAAMCTIDVDGVGFHGVEFLLVAGGATAVDLFDISQTTAVTGLAFSDCWFNLNSVDKAGKVRALAIDDATNATTGMVLKNCRFLGADATTGAANCVDVGVGGIPDALIEDNVFVLESADGDAIGINFADPAAAGPSYAMTIRNNDFIGAKDGGVDTVGIVFASAMTDNEILGMIRTNYFSGAAAVPITTDESSGSCVNNYTQSGGAGGTLIDVVA